MKAIFIACNQAFYDDLIESFDRLGIRGYTSWDSVAGRGSRNGEPHLGDHTWPELNSALLVIADDQPASRLLEQVAVLNAGSPRQGIRAFWWDIGGTI